MDHVDLLLIIWKWKFDACVVSELKSLADII